MRLDEIMRSPVRYRMVDEDMHKTVPTFEIEGRDYRVVFKEDGEFSGKWGVMFARDKSLTLSLDKNKNHLQPTGEGGAFQVFSTVKVILRDLILKNNPKFLFFKTKHPKLSSVYEKLVQAFKADIGMLGYDIGRGREDNGMRVWALIRSDQH